MPNWLLLATAIAFEVTATMFLRVSDGLTRLWPTVIVIAGYVASFFLLSLILRTGVQTGIIYAIWSAFGIALVTLLGMMLFDDHISIVTGIGLVVVMLGVVLVQVGNPSGVG
jgi:small multidrug resistance pump